MKQTFLILAVLYLLLNPAFAHEGHNEAFVSKKEQTAKADQKIVVNEEGQEAIGIKTQTVEKNKLKQLFQTTGQVQAADNRAFDVNPPMSGRVNQVYAKQGDQVKKGQLLATIHSPEIAATLSTFLQDRARMQADITTTKTRVQRDIAIQSNQVELTRANFTREETLLKEGITARKDYIEAQNAYETAKVELRATRLQASQQIALLERQMSLTTAAIKKQLQAMGLPIETINNTLGNWNVTAEIPILSPVTGTITYRDITQGETLDPGKRLFSIVNLHPIWVVLNVYQEQIATIKVDQSVSMVTPDGFKVSGNISSIGAVIDSEKRTLPVRVVSDNLSEHLKPGMFVKADIVIGQSDSNSIVIPASALLEEGSQPVVYVKEDNAFIATPVKIGQKTAEQVEVLSGLQYGSEIVIQGAKQIQAQGILAGDSQPAIKETHEHEKAEKAPVSMWMWVLIGLFLLGLVVYLGAMLISNRSNSRRRS